MKKAINQDAGGGSKSSLPGPPLRFGIPAQPTLAALRFKHLPGPARALVWLALLPVWAAAGEAQSTVPPHLRDLQSPLPMVRQRAAAGLGASSDRSAVPALCGLLQDASPQVRREAARALGLLRDSRAVPGLLESLRDDDPNVRFYAAGGLGEIKDRRAAEGLLAALADEHWNVRDQAAWALRELRDPQLAAPLAALLHDPRADTSAVTWLLAELGPEHAVEPLAELLNAANSDVRLRAVRVLSTLDGPLPLPPLLRALEDAERGVRLAAAVRLSGLGDETIRDPLARRAGLEQDEAVRQALQAALLQFSPQRHLAAWWSFDDAAQDRAEDKSGRGNEGQIQGCPSVPGRVGLGLRFGPGKYIELGQPRGLPIAGRPFTVMAWARAESPQGVVVARGGAFCGYSLYFKDSAPRFGLHREQDGPTYIAAGLEPCTGVWVHLAGVVHGDRIELYVNGRLAATEKTSGYLPSNCGQGMQIGFDAGNSPAELTDSFQGVLDEIKCYQAALTGDEIHEILAAETAASGESS